MKAPMSIRFNDEEQLTHEWLKEFFGFKGVFGEDSQTIKQAESVCMNVLRNTFGSDVNQIFQRRSKDELIKMREVQTKKRLQSNTQAEKNQ